MSGKNKTNRRLKLSLEKTFENVTLKVPLQIKINTSLKVIATVETENIQNCEISISYPSDYLELENGMPLVKLAIRSLSHEEDIFWVLKAINLATEKIWIEIKATGDGLMQNTGFPMEVI